MRTRKNCRCPCHSNDAIKHMMPCCQDDVGIGSFMQEQFDAIVSEGYCLVCQGPCTNKDPEDFDHIHAEFESFVGAWLDRGMSPASVWAYLVGVVLSIARDNQLPWDQVKQQLEEAWNRVPEEPAG